MSSLVHNLLQLARPLNSLREAARNTLGPDAGEAGVEAEAPCRP